MTREILNALGDVLMDDVFEIDEEFQQREHPWSPGRKPHRDRIRDLLAEARDIEHTAESFLVAA